LPKYGGVVAEITTVKITYGKLKAIIEISYRWYVSGRDPWERIEGLLIVPDGGKWSQYDSGIMSLDNGKGDSSMWLKGFDRKDVGRTGKGTFHGFDGWYNIPKYADINWEITSFD
jgi:hypothetical protein